MKNDKICTCTCHKDGFNIMHCMPCCEYTYEKYTDKDGNIDMERYGKIVKAYKERMKK